MFAAPTLKRPRSARGLCASFWSECSLSRMAEFVLGNEDDTQLDLLIYVAGDTLRNIPAARPVNATKVINVRAVGLVLLGGGVVNGANIDQCENHDLGLVRHSCVPSNRQLLDLMARELDAGRCRETYANCLGGRWAMGYDDGYVASSRLSRRRLAGRR